MQKQYSFVTDNFIKTTKDNFYCDLWLNAEPTGYRRSFLQVKNSSLSNSLHSLKMHSLLQKIIWQKLETDFEVSTVSTHAM